MRGDMTGGQYARGEQGVSEMLGPFELGRVHHADCLEAMRLLPDECVDAVVTDPPFTQRTSEGARTGDRGRGGRYIDFDGIDGKETEIAVQSLRITRRWVVIFCAFEQIALYAASASDSWVRAGVWHKPDAMPQMTGDRPAMCGEGIAIMHRPGRKRWNGHGRPAFWECGTERNRCGHPTQKPIPLMLSLLRDFTDARELVLDPFAGSGTTGVACVHLGRRFLGFDIDQRWVDLANRRIAAEHERLGEVRPADARPLQQVGLFSAFGAGADVVSAGKAEQATEVCNEVQPFTVETTSGGGAQ